MGLLLIVLITAVVLAPLGLIINGTGTRLQKNHHHTHILNIFGITMIVSSAFLVLFAFCGFVATGVGLINADVNKYERILERSTIERSIMELDYVEWPSILNEALQFNKKEKLISFENSTWLYKYWTRTFSVDTIAIPQNKSTHRSIIKLESE